MCKGACLKAQKLSDLKKLIEINLKSCRLARHDIITPKPNPPLPFLPAWAVDDESFLILEQPSDSS